MLALVEQHQSISQESEWIAKAAAGDRNAFRSLYELHHQRVYALALRLSSNPSIAEEITQDCFVRLWQKLPSFRGDSQFSTWLHKLVVNQSLTTIKKHKSWTQRFLGFENVNDPIKEDEYDELDQLIMKLPERARIVFVLHAVEGYRHDEIANLLKIATGTSKAQYHRARKLLKEML
ncbi:RNA polymerase subunit sigma-70 [Shewanella sp. OPT22]|nr:RNA polymerase subunit sigma-70 [Shewanella sp. OPT22]